MTSKSFMRRWAFPANGAKMTDNSTHTFNEREWEAERVENFQPKHPNSWWILAESSSVPTLTEVFADDKEMEG